MNRKAEKPMTLQTLFFKFIIKFAITCAIIFATNELIEISNLFREN